MTDHNQRADDRLDTCETNWSLIRQACRESTTSAAPARAALVVRYLPAISRYVAAIVQDAVAAEDLTQDVATKLMEGGFSAADPSRGRFRDYLKTAVRNFVRNHWRRQKTRAASELPETLADDSKDDSAWDNAWRSAVLDMAWRAMENWERRNEGAVAFTLLRIRVDEPDWSLDEVAAQLTQVTGKPFLPNAVRTQLHRARRRFTEFLLTEVARTLQEPSPQELEEELAALGLLEYLDAA